MLMSGCCCNQECREYSDTFDRSNSTDIGSDYTEVSGDWSIATNMLHEAGTSGAVVTLDAWVPTRGMVYVDSLPANIANGTKHRVIVGYRDSSNYFYAELAYVTGSATISLHQVSTAGGDVTLKTETWAATLASSVQFIVCFASDEFAALIPGNPWWLWLRAADFSFSETLDKKIGFGNGAAVAIDFDRFTAYDHKKVNALCPRCICHCAADMIPPDADLHITSTPGAGCACYAVDDTLPQTEGIQWTLIKFISCLGGGGGGGSSAWTKFYLTCDDDVEGTASFTLTVDESPYGITPLVLSPSASSTCDPLNLIFETDTSEIAWKCFGYVIHDPPIPITFTVTE